MTRIHLMCTTAVVFAVLGVLAIPGCAPKPAAPSRAAAPAVAVRFEPSSAGTVPEDVQGLVVGTANEVARSVDSLLPALPDSIALSVVVIDRDLSVVGGVTGRAPEPGAVLVEISSSFAGGVGEAVRAGLASTLYHELHHLARGWTIEGNRFAPGLPNAVVNEGLAQVFAETYSGAEFAVFGYPAEAAAWLAEMLALPPDASYDAWMNQHPDGRIAVGYRVGRYVVHQAMRRSGQSIVELSQREPGEILALARE